MQVHVPVKPAKPSIETITPTTAVFTGDLRKKRENEIYTLVICSVTGEKVDSKQLSGRGKRETISTELLAPDTQYSACLRASLQIDQSEDITADGESLLFTTTGYYMGMGTRVVEHKMKEVVHTVLLCGGTYLIAGKF